ncbi:hypothetical protein PV396_42420 [Streptomyces sp. ME02-8801-2C]|uniref:hypothetical protein n=1 Tax=Streptomyces sp. ME02-8801-2C TaxID=3028680 RepID=UPI0029BB0EB4|nr:hypothetical protein [Streptomyces sp. ME02-8801-2C]MDX3458519.1 hypothetical protein [Streptomyces sp. ME02-8801-2C]
MLTVPPLPPLDPPYGWRVVLAAGTRFTGRFHLHGPGTDTDVEVEVERCAAGRLRDTYPVSAHDVEVRGASGALGRLPSAALRMLVEAVWTADPRCRRVVHAVSDCGPNSLAEAEAAGFRHVLDVDLADEQLRLLVAEPEWVTGGDRRLDRVPQT